MDALRAAARRCPDRRRRTRGRPSRRRAGRERRGADRRRRGAALAGRGAPGRRPGRAPGARGDRLTDPAGPAGTGKLGVRLRRPGVALAGGRAVSAAGRPLRSQAWFGADDLLGRLIHRSWQRKDGAPGDMLDGRPVIGICNTWSELTPCNVHLRALADRVRRAVLEAGGYPVEFPVMSLGESLLRPTAMLFRNLVSMEVEESIRGHPIDGVVLMCGCDKTTPALLMGAASCDLPTIVVSGGPMLGGRYRGAVMGSGKSV